MNSGNSDSKQSRGRYRSTPSATFVSEGATICWRSPRILPPLDEAPKDARTASVRPGERLDQLAARLLGDPAAYYLLTDANPSLDPLRFVEERGALVTLPSRSVPR